MVNFLNPITQITESQPFLKRIKTTCTIALTKNNNLNNAL